MPANKDLIRKDLDSDDDLQLKEKVPTVKISRGKYDIFDKLAFNVLSYLNTFEEVTDIDFNAPDGTTTMCSLWENTNSPYLLPFDIKGFTALFNGMSLSWAVDVGTTSVRIGEIQINKVESIVEVEMNGQFTKHYEDSGVELVPPDPLTTAAFAISTTNDGIVAMLFRTKPINEIETTCEIWFQDSTTSNWHFICHTFTQYLRLSVLHLGIFGWHKIFTHEGITMSTRQWMGMFCRERLCVYQHAATAAKMNKNK
jgi:tubulin polyglutamylase complex subunit 2